MKLHTDTQNALLCDGCSCCATHMTCADLNIQQQLAAMQLAMLDNFVTVQLCEDLLRYNCALSLKAQCVEIGHPSNLQTHRGISAANCSCQQLLSSVICAASSLDRELEAPASVVQHQHKCSWPGMGWGQLLGTLTSVDISTTHHLDVITPKPLLLQVSFQLKFSHTAPSRLTSVCLHARLQCSHAEVYCTMVPYSLACKHANIC